MKTCFFAIVIVAMAAAVPAQQLTEKIRINQIGFYTDGRKVAVVAEPESVQFFVVTPDFADTMFSGTLGPIRYADMSDERVRIADFSDLKRQGDYVLWVPMVGHSPRFSMKPDVHRDAARAALKGFYFQRSSTELPEEYAGKWSRPGGHPDDHVLVHPSAATRDRPAGTAISAPFGWYDAGDYNKYVVNSGITMGTLLSLYEDFPSFMSEFSVRIPDSGNGLPDVLNEVLWNLRWMLAMQDPYDGGVYHKLTNPQFDAIVMPANATEPRFVVQKSTAAALNFAAVTAQAGRIFREFEDIVPGLADSCAEASINAWRWARKNPDILYNQQRLNERYEPQIDTGTYGDDEVSDEFTWAAAELYATTGQDSFYAAVTFFPEEETRLPTWRQVRTLAYYTLARPGNELTPSSVVDLDEARRRILSLADDLMEGAETSAYQTVMGQRRSDFPWGSNSVAANQGVALIHAYRLSGDVMYLEGALSNLDYILGRNAAGYSFLTGHGSKTAMYPHHRPSEASGLREPVPGLLVGGPNPGQQDGCDYPSELPALSYVDDWCSYASNEIAINWNAPFVYLAAALEALQQEAGWARSD